MKLLGGMKFLGSVEGRTTPDIRNRRYGQQGVVLYVALIMLVLLALVGVIGMQIAGLQERMSANYRATHLAFQSTERLVRQSECGVEDLINRTSTPGCAAHVSPDACDDGFSPMAWSEAMDINSGDKANVRSIGPCVHGNGSLGMGGRVNETPNPVYQITAHSTDRAGGSDPTAQAAIDIVFRP